MFSDYQIQKIQDRIASIRSRPSVGLFLDFDNLLADLDEYVDDETFANLKDQDVANMMHTLATAIGRPTVMKMYYSVEVEREDGIEHKAWRVKNIAENRTYPEWITKEAINMKMVLDAHEAAVTQQINIAVLVTGQVTYIALAKQLINLGVTVVMVGNYEKEDRILPKDSSVYIPIRSIMMREGATTNTVDLEKFDYRQLIRLLATSEDLMPFVGVRYFIHEVMWRLGGTQFKDPYTRQQVFQVAKDRELIEVHKQDNVKDDGKPVSACKLNRDNELVRSTLLELEDATTPRVVEQYDEEGNLIEAAE